MPLVLKTLEESSCRGKDMPLVLDEEGPGSESLGLVQETMTDDQNAIRVQLRHDGASDPLSLAISNSQSQIQVSVFVSIVLLFYFFNLSAV